MLQQSAVTVPYLGRGAFDIGYLLMAPAPDLGCEVAPHSLCYRPSMCSSSSGTLLCRTAATTGPVWVGEDKYNNFSSFLMPSISGWYNPRGLSLEGFLHISEHSGNLSMEILFPFRYALSHLAKKSPVTSAAPWYLKTGAVPRPKKDLKYSDSLYMLPIC